MSSPLYLLLTTKTVSTKTCIASPTIGHVTENVFIFLDMQWSKLVNGWTLFYQCFKWSSSNQFAATPMWMSHFTHKYIYILYICIYTYNIITIYIYIHTLNIYIYNHINIYIYIRINIEMIFPHASF